MRLGIFARTYARPSVEETFDAVCADGLDATQFNFSVAGLASLPDRITDALASRIAAAARTRELEIAAVSGTFNMAHPDERVRAGGLGRLDVIAAACRMLDCGIVTLCTGSRDPDDMWRRHPDNASPAAWRDMRATIAEAIAIADRQGIVLAIEPEVGNVVDSPRAARRLLDELGSARLRVVIDAANLPRAPLEEAFALLGDDIVLAHAKDVTASGAFVAAGQGDVDWERYLGLLATAGYDGPLIMHGLEEADVPGSAAFLRGLLDPPAPPERSRG